MAEPEEAVSGKGFALVLAFLSAWLLDQSVKLWVEEHAHEFAMAEGGDLPLVFLSYVENSSALFGWMVGWPEVLRLTAFGGVVLLAAFLALLIYRGLAPGDWLSSAALGLFIGGAVSNWMDRVRLGASVDLFRLPVPSYLSESVPVFNLADVFIVCGGVILLIELVVQEGRERATAPGRSED